MKIIGICGSLRSDSWNLKLLINAINLAVAKGVDARYIGLAGLPLFNPDAEERPSHEVDALRRAVREADAVIIASPEHNGSMTAALKNAIEWLVQGRQRHRPQGLLHHGCQPWTLRGPENERPRLLQP